MCWHLLSLGFYILGMFLSWWSACLVFQKLWVQFPAPNKLMHACNLSIEWWLQEDEKLKSSLATYRDQGQLGHTKPCPKNRQKSEEKEEVQGFTSTSFYAQISERICSHLNFHLQQVVVSGTCNSSIREAGVKGFWVYGQHKVHRKFYCRRWKLMNNNKKKWLWETDTKSLVHLEPG